MTNRATRALHLVDIENLTGTPLPSAAQVEFCRRIYMTDHVTHGDLVIVASSHKAFPSVGFAWLGARHVLRSGKDGADLALLDVLHNERVEERFASVFVASGDGIFTDAAAWLGGHGIKVTVVSQRAHLAGRLRLAASEVRLLDLSTAAEVSA